MSTLSNKELAHISGGFSKTLFGGIVIGVIFIASVIYGFINPNRCN